MNWLRRLFGRDAKHETASGAENSPSAEPEEPSTDRPPWLAPSDAGNPFGVELLNLMSNLKYTAMTKDPVIAERSTSWRAGQQGRVGRPVGELVAIDCDLTFPAAEELPDGMLFCPECMEDKWVIAWVEGEIRMARSWTGETFVVAPATLRGGSLSVQRILLDMSAFASLGDPVCIFDWMLRVHALGQRIPLVVSEQGARALEETPLLGFSLFGHRLFAAAKEFAYPEPKTVLCSDGEVVAAIQAQDAVTLERLLGGGASGTVPSTLDGYRPVHLAMVLKNRAVLEVLLRHGAPANHRAWKGTTPLHAGIGVGADVELLGVLLAHGADLEAGDDKGFRPLHEAVQRNNPEIVRWLVDRGADIEARTENGLTPLHVACGLGCLAAAKVLHERGANMRAESPLGLPMTIVDVEGKTELRDWLLSVA